MASGNTVILSVLLVALQYPAFTYAPATNGHPPRAAGNTGCLCPGDTLQFDCTNEGGGTTIWRGTLLSNCTGSTDVRHQNFGDDERNLTNITCRDRAINVTVWYRREEAGNNSYSYHSRLNVSRALASPSLKGTTVVCAYYDGSSESNTFTRTVIDPYCAPVNLHREHGNTTHLTFSWDPLILSCPSLQYDIHTKNCGDCPSTSKSSSFLCENVDITTSARMCSVVVQARCGDMAGNMSDILHVLLQIPEAPHITTIPTYANENGSMLSLNVTLNEATSFNTTIQLSDAISNNICGSKVIDSSNGGCSHVFDITTSQCASTDIVVTAFAKNMFGDGPTSMSMLGAQNRFVNIEFDNSGNFKAVVCNFLDKATNGLKSCAVNVTHGNNCERHFGLYSGKGLGDSVTVEMANLPSKFEANTKEYCFTIIAQCHDSSTTVVIQGALNITENVPMTGGHDPKVVAGAVIAAVIVLLTIIVNIIIFCRISKKDANMTRTVRAIEFCVHNEPGCIWKATACFDQVGAKQSSVKTIEDICTSPHSQDTPQPRQKFCITYFDVSNKKTQTLMDKLKKVGATHIQKIKGQLFVASVSLSVKNKDGRYHKLLQMLFKDLHLNILRMEGGESQSENVTPGTGTFKFKVECSQDIKSLKEQLEERKDITVHEVKEYMTQSS